MQTEYIEALTELYSNKSGVVPIAFVEWWLLKYVDLYSPHRYRLPPLLGTSDDSRIDEFRRVFPALEELAEHHRSESLCKKALEDLDTIDALEWNKDNSQLKNWMNKYKELGEGNAAVYILAATIDQDSDECNIGCYPSEIEIFRADFKYLLAFNVHFYTIYALLNQEKETE